MKKLLFFIHMVFISLFLSANDGIAIPEPTVEVKAVASEEETVQELGKYLQGAAEYCVKLKESAFHFICRETVTIILKNYNRYGDVIEQVDRTQYDYQLLNVENRVHEQRLPVKKNQANPEKNSVSDLVFSFLNERAVFGPGTLLSKERQENFKYEITKFRKQNHHQFVVVRVIPKKEGEFFFSDGEVWIDTENHSVRKIVVEPRYINGYEKLEQAAHVLKTRLFLHCEIIFDQEYNGLFFPTEVNIVETYQGGPIITKDAGIKGLEHSRTVFSYQDYRFFKVKTDVRYE